MVKINGVKANNIFDIDTKKQKKPTLNQILDKMEDNYQNVNIQSNSNNFDKQNTYQNSSGKNYENQNNTNSNLFSNLIGNLTQNDNTTSAMSFNENQTENNNLLMSVLPLMLNNKGKNIKNSQELIFKEMIKNSNNPRLAQLVKLLPKLMNNNKPNFTEVQETLQKKEEPKIDSFTKTNDYVD